MGWIGWALNDLAQGNCLTVDADELLILPHHKARTLPDLTAHLDSIGVESFGAMMLDCIPKGLWVLAHINRALTRLLPCRALIQMGIGGEKGRYGYLDIRGGARERAFFGERPRRAHLHKVPLIRWQPGFCMLLNAFALPRRSTGYDARDGQRGVTPHCQM